MLNRHNGFLHRYQILQRYPTMVMTSVCCGDTNKTPIPTLLARERLGHTPRGWHSVVAVLGPDHF